MFDGLDQKYGLILADPAWTFRIRSEKGNAKSAQAQYPCMTAEQINEMPVADLAAEQCVLVLWATAPLIPQQLKTVEAWGFEYCTMGAWAKRSKSGEGWAFGTGYWLRSAAEFFIIGTRGRPRLKAKNERNLIVSKVREHSRKPDSIYRKCMALADGPYLELFARQCWPGWDAWGNQKDKFTVLK